MSNELKDKQHQWSQQSAQSELKPQKRKNIDRWIIAALIFIAWGAAFNFDFRSINAFNAIAVPGAFCVAIVVGYLAWKSNRK